MAKAKTPEVKMAEDSASEPAVKPTVQELRKAQLIADLIEPVAEDTEEVKEVGAPKQAPTVNAFEGGSVIAGPFSRKRVGKKTEKKPVENSLSPRRGVYKIWDNKPVNNVGDGKNTFDVAKDRR